MMMILENDEEWVWPWSLGCAQLGEIPSMNPSRLLLRDDDDDDDDEGTFKREANALCMWLVGNSCDCSNPNIPETCIIIILDHGVTTPLTSLFPSSSSSSSSSSNQAFWWGVLWDPQAENTSLLLDIVESHRDGLTTGGMNVYFPSSFCQLQQKLYGNQIDWELCTCQTTKTFLT